MHSRIAILFLLQGPQMRLQALCGKLNGETKTVMSSLQSSHRSDHSRVLSMKTRGDESVDEQKSIHRTCVCSEAVKRQRSCIVNELSESKICIFMFRNLNFHETKMFVRRIFGTGK